MFCYIFGNVDSDGAQKPLYEYNFNQSFACVYVYKINTKTIGMPELINCVCDLRELS